MSAERFSAYPLTFIHGAAVNMNVVQLGDFNISPNSRDSEIIPGGAVDRARIGVVSADPVLSFSTMDLASVLGTTAAPVCSITSGLLATGVVTFRLQERAQGGTFETGATHETWTAPAGSFLRPVSLSASQDDDGAVLQCEVTALSTDGLTAPLTHATGVDFSSAPAPAFGSRYYMGPVFIDGTEVGGIESVSIDFGIDFQAKRFDGNPFAKLGAIVRRQPVLTFTTAKVDAITGDLFGRSISSSFAFHFWLGSANSTRTAKASTVHMNVSGTAGKWCDETVSVSGNEDGTVSVKIYPTGTLAIDLDGAIA